MLLEVNISLFLKTNTSGSELSCTESPLILCHKFFQCSHPFLSHRYNVDSRSCNISKHVSSVCQSQMTVWTQRNFHQPSNVSRCIQDYSHC